MIVKYLNNDIPTTKYTTRIEIVNNGSKILLDDGTLIELFDLVTITVVEDAYIITMRKAQVLSTYMEGEQSFINVAVLKHDGTIDETFQPIKIGGFSLIEGTKIRLGFYNGESQPYVDGINIL